MRWPTILLASLFLVGCGGDEFEEKPQADAGGDTAETGDVDAQVAPDAPTADAEAGTADADAAADPDAADAAEDAEAGPSAEIEFSPTTASFPETWLFSPSPPVKITLANKTPSAAAVSGLIAVSLDNSVDFSIKEDNCDGKTLSGQASCDIYVLFKPAHTGEQTGKLIAFAEPGGTTVVNLSGQGKTSVTLAQDAYSQWPATTKVGGTSEGQFFLQNTSAEEIGPLIFTIEPPDTIFEFAPNSCGNTVSGSGSCHPHVRFKPSAAGTFKGTLRVVVPNAGGAEAPFEFVAVP